jgi:hypothetical protein
LRPQGRLVEARPTQRAALRIEKSARRWRNAAIFASNLSEIELLIGEIAAALVTAERSISYADRSGNDFQKMVNRTTYGAALHAAGWAKKAGAVYEDAERRQKLRQPSRSVLSSIGGYRYCDLLLAKGGYTAARNRANETLEWATKDQWLLDVALDTLILGRAHLGLALDNDLQRPIAATREDACTAHARLDAAVDGLRGAGTTHHIPRGLLARAAFRRSVGDWDGAGRDLDEVEEIAEPGPMRLFLCDRALERARLAFARIEAFAPLNGMIDGGPPKPTVPQAEEAARLREEARANLAEAKRLITECGYHRRDEELAELEAVLAGERRFADLPPRV